MTGDPEFPISRRFYRLLLRLYPTEFREARDTEMEDVYVASLRIQVGRRGVLGLPFAWMRILWDTLWHASSLRRSARGSRGLRRNERPGWSLRWLAEDARFAARHLGRNPSFTVTAVATLGLGIGLNAAVFAAVYSFLLRPLPGVEAPDELVQVYRSGGVSAEFLPSSIPLFRDLQADSTVFSGVTAWTLTSLNLSVDDRAEHVVGQVVSSAFFEVLGVRMELGRGFDEGDDGRRVVVLSHGFWQRHFGGDPGIVGRTVGINGARWQIVGVAPRAFRGPFPIVAPVLWAPLSWHAELMRSGDQSEGRGNNFLDVVARLGPGVTLERATRWANRLTAHLREEYPEHYAQRGIQLSPQRHAGIHPAIRSAQVRLSVMMIGLVGLLLLIAALNVTMLFLAKARARRREVAVRRSIGAPRRRLVEQFLVEGLILSLLAGGAGVVLAHAIVGAANRVHVHQGWPIEWNVDLGPPALVFTLGTIILVGLLFGLAPSVMSSRLDVVSSLRESPGRRSSARAGQILVGLQVAMSTVLLVCAGLFAKNLWRAMAVDTGFRTDNVLLATLDPGLQGDDPLETQKVFTELMSRMRVVPGVLAVGLGKHLPLAVPGSQRSVEIPGYRPSRGESMNVQADFVDPEYFALMGIPVLEGRAFRGADGSPDGSALIVNRRFADRFWPGEDPIGKAVVANGRAWQVVGLVPTGKYRSLGEEPTAFMYFPWPTLHSPSMTIHIRTTADPGSMVPLLRREVAAIDPDLPLYDVRTMKEHLGFALLPARLAGIVLGGFGAFCLLLLAVGLHGVVAYTVSQRRREVGIRVAIGAEPRSVTTEIMREEIRVVLAGVVMGIGGALAASRLLEGVLYSGKAVDPMVLLGAALFLMVVAAIACYSPARRAAQVDPVQALRSE